MGWRLVSKCVTNEGFRIGRVCVAKLGGLICGCLAECGNERVRCRALDLGQS